ncbi:MAG: phosphatase PAP2 family protein [Chlamydiia bacterium]|nr:phosphatase PAP2 family protein [Chlamydiia bacterium]
MHGIAALLLISWLFGPTRMLWDALDGVCFNALNSFVHSSPFWQKFWALAGYKRSEYVMDLVRLVFFALILYNSPAAMRRHNVIKILFMILFIFATITLVGKTLFPKVLQIERFSPTASDPTAFRLSSVIDWIYVKDHSLSSYPSDHGITAWLFTCSMFFLFGKRYGFAALITEGCYCLPRLVAGAHWMTDVIIGSGTVALILCAWVYCTPTFNFILRKRYAQAL